VPVSFTAEIITFPLSLEWKISTFFIKNISNEQRFESFSASLFCMLLKSESRHRTPDEKVILKDLVTAERQRKQSPT